MLQMPMRWHAMQCPAEAGLALGDCEGGNRLVNTMQAALKPSLEGLFPSCALQTPRLCYSAVLLGLQGPCMVLAPKTPLCTQHREATLAIRT